MELQKFIDSFASLFEETDALSFSPQTKYKELDEWSSIMALTTVAMIDRAYKVIIKADDLRISSTLEELFLIVQSKLK